MEMSTEDVAGQEHPVFRALALIQERLEVVTSTPTSSLSDAELLSLIAEMDETRAALKTLLLAVARLLDEREAERPTTYETGEEVQASTTPGPAATIPPRL